MVWAGRNLKDHPASTPCLPSFSLAINFSWSIRMVMLEQCTSDERHRKPQVAEMGVGIGLGWRSLLTVL